jgi:hypothetical protein
MGFADPVNDVIYFPLPFLNSVAVASIAVFAVPRALKKIAEWRRPR